MHADNLIWHAENTLKPLVGGTIDGIHINKEETNYALLITTVEGKQLRAWVYRDEEADEAGVISVEAIR